MNPYNMWEHQTPRQVYNLLRTYRDMHKEDDEGPQTQTTKDGVKQTKHNSGKSYTVIGKVKVPDWLKDRIPDGAIVYDANNVTQDQMMG